MASRTLGWEKFITAAVVVLGTYGRSAALDTVPAEFEACRNWTTKALHQVSGLGFSFKFGGSPSAELMSGWTNIFSNEPGKPTEEHRRIRYRNPVGALEVDVDTVQFSDFPAVEWVCHFRNSGITNSAILDEIKALDTSLPLNGREPAVLHWAKGAVASFDDFAPQQTVLAPGVHSRLEPGGGRSSSGVLPFFNIQRDNGGVMAGIGWSGEWLAEFETDRAGTVRMKAGMERTHLILHPGESIRTPRMLLLFYQGDKWRGQNLLRQFLLAHHRPKPEPGSWIAPVTCGNWGGTPAEVHLDNIAKIAEHQLPIDYYWIDAEWFGEGGWPVNVGTWRVKKNLYPRGFKPLSDALSRTGRKLMLWFEPERVYKGTDWFKEHREWLLEGGGDSLLLNLGDERARKFLTDFISAKISEFGLGCYRQDFNIEPLGFWRKADAPDRQGITEIRYIEGLYAFWDELLARHPGLIIDNCASGGRRIDLETISRATPFWRTDGPRDAIAHQCHTYGLLQWVPLSATSQDRAGDDYEFRSSMCSSLCLNWWVSGDVPAEDIRADFPFNWAKATLGQYLRFRQYYYGDYYPLTGYSQSGELWMAYQMDRQDLGSGLMVVLRRPGSAYESARFALHAVKAGTRYRVTDLDTKERKDLDGADLLEPGLEIAVKHKPGSRLLIYEKRSQSSTPE